MSSQRLILLSGWGVDQRVWQPLKAHWLAALTPQAIDWPGYGEMPALAADASLAQLAEAMAKPLASEAVWVGWSLGGLLATALLEYLPAPRGLILLGAGDTFCTPDGITSHELSTFQGAFQRSPAATWQSFLRRQTQGEPSPRQAYRQLRDLLGDTLPADSTTLATGLHWLATIDNRSRLMAASCPVIRLSGEHDPFIGPDQRLVSEGISNVGHCPMLSQPQALATVISRHAAQMTNPSREVL